MFTLSNLITFVTAIFSISLLIVKLAPIYLLSPPPPIVFGFSILDLIVEPAAKLVMSRINCLRVAIMLFHLIPR